MLQPNACHARILAHHPGCSTVAVTRPQASGSSCDMPTRMQHAGVQFASSASPTNYHSYWQRSASQSTDNTTPANTTRCKTQGIPNLFWEDPCEFIIPPPAHQPALIMKYAHLTLLTNGFPCSLISASVFKVSSTSTTPCPDSRLLLRSKVTRLLQLTKSWMSAAVDSWLLAIISV